MLINTTNVGDRRWGPPLVKEDWHASCQAIYKGVEGAAQENLYCKFVEMNKEVNVRNPRGGSRAKTFEKVSAANDTGDTYYDQSYATIIKRREEVRQELWSAHLKSPTFTL